MWLKKYAVQSFQTGKRTVCTLLFKSDGSHQDWTTAQEEHYLHKIKLYIYFKCLLKAELGLGKYKSTWEMVLLMPENLPLVMTLRNMSSMQMNGGVTSSLVMRNPAVVWYGLMSNSTGKILIFLTHYLYSVFLLLCLIILCAYVVAVTVASSIDFVFQLTISNIGWFSLNMYKCFFV